MGPGTHERGCVSQVTDHGSLLQSIGDDDDTVESSSAEIMQTEEGFAPVFFDPRPLTNLVLIDELESLSPVLDMQASDTACIPLRTADTCVSNKAQTCFGSMTVQIA